MTFLELVVALSQEAEIPGEGPTSVTDQIGENRALVRRVADAYRSIQLMSSEWKWMKGTFSFQTTASKQNYTPAEAGISSRFNKWVQDGMKIYLTSYGLNDSVPLPFLDYPTFNAIYQTATQAPGRPICFSIDDDDDLLLGFKPNGDYTVTGKYRKAIQELVIDSDVPEMPSDYHMLIVYTALENYALTEAAPELLAKAMNNKKTLMRALRDNQLPAISLAGPLV